MKDRRERKRKILSVRLTEPELQEMNQLMAVHHLSASDLLREALLAFFRQSPQANGHTGVTARRPSPLPA